jgi:hypothetical protein
MPVMNNAIQGLLTQEQHEPPINPTLADALGHESKEIRVS